MKYIVVCFEYSDENHLCNAFHDIYTLVPFLRNFPKEDIVLITDIVNSQILSDAIEELRCTYNSPEDCLFYRNLIMSAVHLPKSFLVDDPTFSIRTFLSSINNPVFFYYSGHVADNCILLPDGSTIDVELIKKKLINVEFMVVDSCYAKSMQIPTSATQFFSCKDDEIILGNFKENFTSNLFKYLKINSSISEIVEDLQKNNVKFYVSFEHEKIFH